MVLTILMAATMMTWSTFSASYPEWAHSCQSYQPEPESCAALSPLVENLEVTIYLGTWCSDSEREVPRILAILSCAGYPVENIPIHLVDRDKVTESGMVLPRVPVADFMKDGVLFARFIERPGGKLDEALLQLLKEGGELWPEFSSPTPFPEQEPKPSRKTTP